MRLYEGRERLLRAEDRPAEDLFRDGVVGVDCYAEGGVGAGDAVAE